MSGAQQWHTNALHSAPHSTYVCMYCPHLYIYKCHYWFFYFIFFKVPLKMAIYRWNM